MNILKSLKNITEKRIGDKYITKIVREEFFNQTYISFNERSVEYAFVFRQLTNFCPIDILDVGTGTTALPHLMKNCGFKVTAIDNVRDYWPKGMLNRHFYVINDDITTTGLNQRFDLITCISTLEHIVKYDIAIENMVGLLNEGGKIILTFPYNEGEYCENVYFLPDSNAPKNFPFITQAFSHLQLDNWCKNNNLRILEQEYWQYFSGKYWTTGERLEIPKISSKFEKHQISCIILEKN